MEDVCSLIPYTVFEAIKGVCDSSPFRILIAFVESGSSIVTCRCIVIQVVSKWDVLQVQDASGIVERLLGFLEVGKAHITAEALIQIKDLLRRYPDIAEACLSSISATSMEVSQYLESFSKCKPSITASSAQFEAPRMGFQGQVYIVFRIC